MKCGKIDVQATKKSYEKISLNQKRKFISKVKIKSPPSRQNYEDTSFKISGSTPKEARVGPLQYSIYCIANTGFFKNRGSLISSVARGFLDLYNKIAVDRVKSKYLDYWEDTGEKLVIMKGINHKHLEYLAEELYFAAIAIHSRYETWSRNKILLVLSVLGREEELEDFLEGLTELR